MLLSYLQRRRALARADDSATPPLSAAHLADVNPDDATAWFGLSRALMNSDEFINRE
jgi:hypothetical protein